jgi:hypothetical protein
MTSYSNKATVLQIYALIIIIQLPMSNYCMVTVLQIFILIKFNPIDRYPVNL